MSHNKPSGILNINKPGGMTSHDVVNSVRRITNIRKVGHTGTLDPMATGVLLICLNKATRLIEFMTPGQKIYQATLRFGQTTNTYDAEGEIRASAPYKHLTEQALVDSFPRFIGNISQMPPAFSAIKKNGVPLYKLARQGIAVETQPRNVYINAIELLQFDLPHAIIKVTCGPGTYIRSLAHDIGQSLNVGAHLSALTRTANGNWTVEQAISLEQLAQTVAEGALADVLHKKEMAVSHLPQLKLSSAEIKRICQGQAITTATDFTMQTAIAAFDDNNSLIAILKPAQADLLKPKKVFVQPE